jgi:hypothetical protein
MLPVQIIHIIITIFLFNHLTSTESYIAFFAVDISPFHIIAGQFNFYTFILGNRLTGTFFHTGPAAVAKLRPVINRSWLQFKFSKNNTQALTRAELRSKKNFAPADFFSSTALDCEISSFELPIIFFSYGYR